MNHDQWLRGIPYVIIAITLASFATATFVKAWRGWKRTYCPGWPLPWDALTGLFLLSIAVVSLSNMLRVFADWSINTEHRMAYYSLWFCALMSVWMFGRWWKDDGDE